MRSDKPTAAEPLPDRVRELLQASPLQLAQWLAILGGDMPGFDNADRAAMRRAAQAMVLPGGAPAAAELLQASLLQHVGLRERYVWRPECVLQAAVCYLLTLPDASQRPPAGG